MIKYGNNNIGRVIFGTHEIGKAYIGSNLIFTKGIQPGPTPPTESIPYIRNTSETAYINTGITPDNTTKIIVWARNWNLGGTSHTYLFGSRVGNQNKAFGLALPNGAETGKLRIAYGNVNTDLSDEWSILSWYHKYELDGEKLYVDDTLVGSGTVATFSNTLNIYLFGLNNNGNFAGCNLPIDICAVKIYKNNVLVRDLTPVESPSVGFYDSVSETTLTNAGSGSLTYGSFDMSSYTRLEYVDTSNGGAYFDSGVYGGYALPVVAKFRANQMAGGCVLGYRGSSDWEEFDLAQWQSSSDVAMYYRLASDSTWNRFFLLSSSAVVDNDLVLVKGATNSASVYKGNSLLGVAISPTSSTSYVTTATMNIASLKTVNGVGELFKGRLYYVGLGSQRSLVPAKTRTSVGMYDTYNDVFYTSSSSTPFLEPSNN